MDEEDELEEDKTLEQWWEYLETDMKKATQELKTSVENLLKKRRYIPKEKKSIIIDPRSMSGAKYETLFRTVNDRDESKDIFR